MPSYPSLCCESFQAITLMPSHPALSSYPVTFTICFLDESQGVTYKPLNLENPTYICLTYWYSS